MRTDNGKAMKQLSQAMSGEYRRGEFLEEGHWSWVFVSEQEIKMGVGFKAERADRRARNGLSESTVVLGKSE